MTLFKNLSNDSKRSIILALITLWITTIGVVSLIETRWRLEYGARIEHLTDQVNQANARLEDATLQRENASEFGIEASVLAELKSALEEVESLRESFTVKSGSIEDHWRNANNQIRTVLYILESTLERARGQAGVPTDGVMGTLYAYVENLVTLAHGAKVDIEEMGRVEERRAGRR